ncbi:MAG: stage III sporulation protein AA [Firmicutes bacterium]|nr:stage III sporulation protein AA [Bacillota bacterium]
MGPLPEEVRLRVNRPLGVTTSDGEVSLDRAGRPAAGGGMCVERRHIDRALELVTGSSLYAVEDQIRQGFVTLPGGHRVGVAGTAVTEDGAVGTFRDISGANYRVAMEALGSGLPLMPWLVRDDGSPASALIVSPPACGKTTLLRDVVRCFADGLGCNRARRVCLVDERSEVAASSGYPRNDVGALTDVLDGCPKAQGIMIGLRSLSPEVVATDEIGRPEDAAAVGEAVLAGVAVIATVHGRDPADAARRPGVDAVIRQGLFDRAVVLSRRFGPGTVEGVFDLTRDGGCSIAREDSRTHDARLRMFRGGAGDGVDLYGTRQGTG